MCCVGVYGDVICINFVPESAFENTPTHSEGRSSLQKYGSIFCMVDGPDSVKSYVLSVCH